LLRLSSFRLRRGDGNRRLRLRGGSLRRRTLRLCRLLRGLRRRSGLRRRALLLA